MFKEISFQNETKETILKNPFIIYNEQRNKRKNSSQTYNKNQKMSIDYEQLYETLKEDYMNIFNDALKKIEEQEKVIKNLQKEKETIEEEAKDMNFFMCDYYGPSYQEAKENYQKTKEYNDNYKKYDNYLLEDGYQNFTYYQNNYMPSIYQGYEEFFEKDDDKTSSIDINIDEWEDENEVLSDYLGEGYDENYD